MAPPAQDPPSHSAMSTPPPQRIPKEPGLAGVSLVGWIMGALTVLVGAGLIAAGWLLESDGYPSSLLQNAGVAVLLLVPLFAVERTFTHRIRRAERASKDVQRDLSQVETRLDSTATSLDEISKQLGERLDASAAANEDLGERARREVAPETLGALFERAEELRALSKLGLRTVVPHRWERFRVNRLGDVGPSAIGISVEGVRGDPLDISVAWASGESAVTALSSLAEAWRRAGSYPGDAVLDPVKLFPAVIDSLELAISSKHHGGEDPLAPLIEKLSPNWVMTDYGLEHLPMPYLIDHPRLVAELEDWRRQMREKTWAAEEDQKARDNGGADFWMVSEVSSRFFKYQSER